MSVYYEKKASNWWFILGFIVPIAGLILFLVLRENNPLVAKKAGIGALSMAVALVFSLIIVLLYFLNLEPVFQQIPGKFLV